MAFSVPGYAWPFLVAALATGLLVLLTIRHRDTGAARYFLPLVTSAFCWTAFAAITHVTGSPTAKIFWTHIRYVPISLLPVAWLVFAMAYTGMMRRFKGAHSVLLMTIPVITMVLVATHDRQNWMFVETWIETTGTIVSVGHTYGPWFWVNLAFSYGVLALGGILILAHVVRSNSLRSQGLAMILGAVSPVVFNLAYVSSPDAFNQLDPTPIAFAVSTVFFGLALLRYRLFDILPAARSLVFEHITDGAIVLDHGGVVLDVNPAASWLLDLQPGEIAGSEVPSVPPVIGEAWGRRHEAAACGDSRIGEGLDTRWLEWTIAPLAMGRVAGRGIGRGWLIILRDGTVHKEIELRLTEARDRAVELSQLKSNFLANMNHEFRTPLAGIIGLSDILMSELRGERHQLVSMIKEGGERLLGTLDAVLSAMDLYSGKLLVHMTRTDVVDATRATAQQIEGSARAKGLAFLIDTGTLPVYADVDLGHFRQALSNLLENAVKYTHEGHISVRIDRTDREVSVHVIDSGKGISPEFLPHAFESFRQESIGPAREFQGIGLGLQVTKGLVEAMGGRVGVTSALGAGSTFTMVFPLTSSAGEYNDDRSALSRVTENASPSASSVDPVS